MMKTMKGCLVAAAMLVVGQASAAGVTAEEAWVRLLPGTLPGAGYVELKNTGSEAVSLETATSAGFTDIELHRSRERGGMASMEHVERIALPPGEAVVLAPNGYHLMMFGRQPGLEPGGILPVTLGFSDGSSLAVDFSLRSPAGGQADHSHHEHHH